jgi:YHS domain-containing protein
MKSFKPVLLTALLAGVLAAPLVGLAEDAKKPTADAGKTAKAYPLTTCVVSGEKLEGEMGGPYIFTQDGKEVRLCCKSCLKDFKKDPASYMKKIDEAEAKAKK